jgi:hypothetical protein
VVVKFLLSHVWPRPRKRATWCVLNLVVFCALKRMLCAAAETTVWAGVQAHTHSGQVYKHTYTVGRCTCTRTQWAGVQAHAHSGQVYKHTYTVDRCTRTRTQWTGVQAHVHSGQMYKHTYTVAGSFWRVVPLLSSMAAWMALVSSVTPSPFAP